MIIKRFTKIQMFALSLIFFLHLTNQSVVFQINGRVPWDKYQLQAQKDDILFVSIDWDTSMQANTSYSAKIMNPLNVQENRTPLGQSPLTLSYALGMTGLWKIIIQTSNMNPYIPFTLTYNLNNQLSNQKIFKSNPFFYTSANGDFYNFQMPCTDFIMEIDIKNQTNLAMAVGYGKKSISDFTQRNILAVSYGEKVTYISGQNFGKGIWQVFIASTSGSLEEQYFQAIISAVRNCSGEMYSTGQNSQSSDLQCKCIAGYTWSEQNQNCQRDCSMVQNSINVNGQNCVCQKSFAWNRNSEKCEIVCLGIMNGRGSPINRTSCECSVGFDWIFSKRSCDRNCANSLFSTGISQGASCQCIQGYKWNWIRQYCERDCSVKENSNGMIVAGSQNFCQCNSGYIWNAQRDHCVRQGLINGNNTNTSQSGQQGTTIPVNFSQQWYFVVLLIAGAIIIVGGVVVLAAKCIIRKLQQKSFIPQDSERDKPRADTQMNALDGQVGPTLTLGDQQKNDRIEM